MAGPMPTLRIITQPQTPYRIRYICETNRNQPQRFIRAADDSGTYTYPTVEVKLK